MTKRAISVLIISLLIFVFLIFYKGLNNSSFYEPKNEITNIPKFFAKNFYTKEEVDSKKIFNISIEINFVVCSPTSNII